MANILEINGACLVQIGATLKFRRVKDAETQAIRVAISLSVELVVSFYLIY
jgi:hypothetical protein